MAGMAAEHAVYAAWRKERDTWPAAPSNVSMEERLRLAKISERDFQSMEARKRAAGAKAEREALMTTQPLPNLYAPPAAIARELRGRREPPSRDLAVQSLSKRRSAFAAPSRDRSR